MANPILSQPDAFTRSSQYQGYTQQAYQQGPYGAAYDQPIPGYAPQAPVAREGVMTLDDVIAKTAITMLLLVVSAAATWILMPMTLVMPVALVTALVGFVTVLLVSRRAEIPVGGVLAYAVIEGIFIGAISKMFNFLYNGIVAQAVLATFVAAGATLAAYKFFNIRVTPKFRKMVLVGTAALAGVMLVNLLLSFFGVRTGLVAIGSNAGWLAIGVSVLAVGLAVFNLIIDFDTVERGIAQQAPAKESWRAAFGLTITMVWLYIEILRILSYFRD